MALDPLRELAVWDSLSAYQELRRQARFDAAIGIPLPPNLAEETVVGYLGAVLPPARTLDSGHVVDGHQPG